MNLAFNIRCSFSKFQAKQLRNKDVGQQNAHCGASFDISVGECGHSRPDRHLEVLIIILNFPPQWTCAHAHTHTHTHTHAYTPYQLPHKPAEVPCVFCTLMCNSVCVSDICMGWGQLMLWKYPAKQSLFIIPYALKITMIVYHPDLLHWNKPESLRTKFFE